MIGKGYWSTGITVTWMPDPEGDRWHAELAFRDDGFCGDDADKGKICTQGKLESRYYVRPGKTVDALTAVIDAVKDDAERLGITWRVGPGLFIEGDGEDKKYPPPPNWRRLLTEQSKRLGWKPVPYGR